MAGVYLDPRVKIPMLVILWILLALAKMPFRPTEEYCDRLDRGHGRPVLHCGPYGKPGLLQGV